MSTLRRSSLWHCPYLSRILSSGIYRKATCRVIELGAAADRSLTEAESSFGPTAAVEVTPIENFLELEAGVTPLLRKHSTERTVTSCSRSRGRYLTKNEFRVGLDRAGGGGYILLGALCSHSFHETTPRSRSGGSGSTVMYSRGLLSGSRK